jgi:nickel/cobalt transporter (NicO) family protein
MWILGAIFVAGVLHGLGPDHLAAITAFGTRGGNDTRRVVFFSTRFAFGHAVIIVIAGMLAKFGRVMMPPIWEHRFDAAAGWLLVLTGVALLAGLISGKFSLHVHEHDHHTGHHHHLHSHLVTPQKHEHKHGTFAAALGAIFALGGVRALLIVVPVAMAHTVAESILRIGAFVIGITVAMVAYGIATQKALTTFGGGSPRWMRASSYFAAAFCIAAAK